MFKIGDKFKIEVVVNDLCDDGVSLSCESGQEFWIDADDLMENLKKLDKQFLKKTIERQIKELQDKLEKL